MEGQVNMSNSLLYAQFLDGGRKKRKIIIVLLAIFAVIMFGLFKQLFLFNPDFVLREVVGFKLTMGIIYGLLSIWIIFWLTDRRGF